MKKKSKAREIPTQNPLSKKTRIVKIHSVREIVFNRMKQQGMTVYGLARASGILDQTVRNFIDGKGEIRSDKLLLILNALGLEIRAKD